MKIYFKILYIGWLGFCLLVFVMYLGVAYQPHFFWEHSISHYALLMFFMYL